MRTNSNVHCLRFKRRDSGGWVMPPAAPGTFADQARAACRHDVAAVQRSFGDQCLFESARYQYHSSFASSATTCLLNLPCSRAPEERVIHWHVLEHGRYFFRVGLTDGAFCLCGEPADDGEAPGVSGLPGGPVNRTPIASAAAGNRLIRSPFPAPVMA